MDTMTIGFFDADTPRDRVALLLKEFSRLSDEREQQRVLYPLEEVLLLVTAPRRKA